MGKSIPLQSWGPEEQRIRAAYVGRAVQDPRFSWERSEHVFVEQERERRFLAVLAHSDTMPLGDKRILEVGSGTGGRLRDLIKWGANPEHLVGVDLLADSVAHARRLLPAAVTLECRNAADLPFPAASFDLVLQATMFSSILDPALKRRAAQEMLRVLKPTGVILWSDLRLDNPWNDTVRGIGKGELTELFPNCRFDLERHALAGPVVRRLVGYSWSIAHWLGKVPWLCTHYLGTIHPPQA